MLKLYHSNDLEVLKGLMLSVMKQQPPSVFEQESVLVQSQGMAHWLRLNIADELGVAAQLDFPLPSSFVWKVFNRLRPDLPERSHFDKQLMSWKLLRLLPGLSEQPGYEAIAHYLQDDDSGIKCWQLSQTIADVFDQYLVYRPDWLLAWERGEDQVEGADIRVHPWQPGVWRALIQDSQALGHSLSHRAHLLNELPRLVQQHPERLSGLPKRLFVFGIAALPGSYWAVLDAISAHIDVHFFLLNPCRNFWGDIVDDRRRLRVLQQNPDAATYLDKGNPLLASWGRLGRDFLTLVHDSELALDLEAWVEPEPECLLDWIKRDVLELHDRQQAAFSTTALTSSECKQAISGHDDSIRVVSGHSALREVQRLHDQLLFWLDQDASLEPRDIVVMLPDIDQYAPYIDAVFSSASHRIPWAIADQSMARENPVAESLVGLLGLPDSRLTITEVLDWLEVSVIRRRFDISESELDDIKDWLTRARVRWGMDGQQRARLGLPDFEQNSWRAGLRQLVLGLMLPDNAGAWQGDWPVVAVEGNQAELLGKLLVFVDTLEVWQTRLGELRQVPDWLALLPGLLSDFYASDEQATATENPLEWTAQQVSIQRARDAMAQLSDDLEQSGMLSTATEEFDDQTLSIRVLAQWFADTLNQQGGWQRFLAGPVNFCTLMPMRSIPFRVVCLLGMNDADYPRVVPPVGFDLMVAGKARRGDRSRREDDRYLFLEAVCSAQNKLYISYRGHGVRENNPLQPSVLVSELLDYLADGFCLQADREMPHEQSRRHFLDWLVEHLPLQAFNPSVFDVSAIADGSANARAAVPGYHRLWYEVAAESVAIEEKSVATDAAADNTPVSFLSEQPLPLPEDLVAVTTLQWADIKAALRHSVRFFMQRRLQAGRGYEWQGHQTEEPFALAGLDAYVLREQQLDRLLDRLLDRDPDTALETFIQRHQALGDLPVNALGRYQAERLYQQIAPLADALSPWMQEPPLSTSLIVEVENAIEQREGHCAIQGELSGVYSGVLIRYRVGQMGGRYVLDAWLDLVLASAGHDTIHTDMNSDANTDSPVIDAAWVYGLNKKGEVTTLTLRRPDAGLADGVIRQALAHYLSSWQAPQPLLPDLLFSLFAVPPEQHDGLVEKALSSEYGELADPALQRCFPRLPEQLQDSIQRADWMARYEWLFMPLIEHLSDTERH